MHENKKFNGQTPGLKSTLILTVGLLVRNCDFKLISKKQQELLFYYFHVKVLNKFIKNKYNDQIINQ